MRHRLSGLSTYGLNGRCLGDEHPAYAPLGYDPFTFTLLVSVFFYWLLWCCCRFMLKWKGLGSAGFWQTYMKSKAKWRTRLVFCRSCRYATSATIWCALVLCKYSKFRSEANSHFSIRFDSNRAQLFEIFEWLPSPISYLFNRMTPIFHLSNHA